MDVYIRDGGGVIGGECDIAPDSAGLQPWRPVPAVDELGLAHQNAVGLVVVPHFAHIVDRMRFCLRNAAVDADNECIFAAS